MNGLRPVVSDQLSAIGLPPTPPAMALKIREAAERMRPYEHTFRVAMEHHLWGGMYARTARVPAAQAFTSVLIKVPTIVIVQGDCCVFAGEKWRHLKGYSVLQACAGRMQAYVTLGDTEITMVFPSSAETVEEAEAEMTDEAGSLLSRRREAQA